MKYKYRAKTKSGEEQTGFVDAANRDAAITILTSHELFILSIEETEKVRWYDRVSSYFGRVKRKDLVVFSRQMAVLMEAQLPLTSVIKTLENQTTHPVLKEAALRGRIRYFRFIS